MVDNTAAAIKIQYGIVSSFVCDFKNPSLLFLKMILQDIEDSSEEKFF